MAGACLPLPLALGDTQDWWQAFAHCSHTLLPSFLGCSMARPRAVCPQDTSNRASASLQVPLLLCTWGHRDGDEGEAPAAAAIVVHMPFLPPQVPFLVPALCALIAPSLRPQRPLCALCGPVRALSLPLKALPVPLPPSDARCHCSVLLCSCTSFQISAGKMWLAPLGQMRVRAPAPM